MKKTIIIIEEQKYEQINHEYIKGLMYGLNERYGNDITVTIDKELNWTVEQNAK